jgi:hypothetical protein
VVKKETVRLQRVPHFNVPAQLAIVITGNHHHLTTLGKAAQELGRFARGRFVVNEVAQDDQLARLIFVDQLGEPIGNRRHPPHGDKGASRALAQLVTKMEVRHREPALGLMEKRKPAVEKDIRGDKRLVRAKQGHRQAIWPDKLRLRVPAAIGIQRLSVSQ